MVLSARVRRLATFIAVVIGSVATFAILLLIAPPSWRSTEYIAIGFWSLPVAGLVLLTTRGPRYVAGRWGMTFAIPVAAILAFTCALAWTFLVFLGSADLILGTFDANPLWSWAVGAFIGMIVSLLWPATPNPRHAPPNEEL
jgi:hypothetical protein